MTPRKINYLKFPLFIKWYVTELCNLRCKHCYLSEYKSNSNLKLILEFIDFFKEKGVSGYSLLGGEPLIRKDLELIIERIVNYGQSLNISTNGILATKERSKSLVAAGLKNFQVSLDSHDPEKNNMLRGAGSFDKIVSGIHNLNVAGARVKIGHTLSKVNFKDIGHMCELAHFLGVDELRFEVFIPTGTGEKNKELLLMDKNELNAAKALLFENMGKYKFKITSPFRFSEKTSCNCSQQSTFGCGAGTTNLIINSNMSLAACDLLFQKDITKPVTSAAELEDRWINDDIFKKWRGLSAPENDTYGDFKNVNQDACYLAKTNYPNYSF